MQRTCLVEKCNCGELSFRCQNCGDSPESVQKPGEYLLSTCPTCEGHQFICGDCEEPCASRAPYPQTYVISACRICVDGGACSEAPHAREERHAVAGVQALSKDDLYDNFYRTVLYLLEHDGQIEIEGEISQCFTFEDGAWGWAIGPLYSFDSMPYVQVLRNFLQCVMDPPFREVWSESASEQFTTEMVFGGKTWWFDLNALRKTLDDCLCFEEVMAAGDFC